MTAPERSPCGTAWTCGSIFSSRPSPSSRSTIILRAAKRNTPLNSRIVAWSCGVSVDTLDELGIRLQDQPGILAQHVDHGQAVALADLEIVEVVRRA